MDSVAPRKRRLKLMPAVPGSVTSEPKPTATPRPNLHEVRREDDVPIESGEHDAIATGTWQLRLKVFGGGSAKLEVEFKVYPLGLERPDVFRLVNRYYRVEARSRGSFTAKENSDYTREWREFVGEKARLDRMVPSRFKGAVARVEVRIVEKDRRQRALHELNQYPVIARVLGRKEPRSRQGS